MSVHRCGDGRLSAPMRACTDGWVRGRGGAHNTGKRVHVWAGVWKEGENERRAEK